MTEGKIFWLTIAACWVIFLGAANAIGSAIEPSDTEADQAVAADKAQAPIDAAMVAFGAGPDVVWEGMKR